MKKTKEKLLQGYFMIMSALLLILGTTGVVHADFNQTPQQEEQENALLEDLNLLVQLGVIDLAELEVDLEVLTGGEHVAGIGTFFRRCTNGLKRWFHDGGANYAACLARQEAICLGKRYASEPAEFTMPHFFPHILLECKNEAIERCKCME